MNARKNHVEEWLPVGGAATKTGVHVRSVYRLAKAGKVKARVVDGKLHVEVGSLRAHHRVTTAESPESERDGHGSRHGGSAGSAPVPATKNPGALPVAPRSAMSVAPGVEALTPGSAPLAPGLAPIVNPSVTAVTPGMEALVPGPATTVTSRSVTAAPRGEVEMPPRFDDDEPMTWAEYRQFHEDFMANLDRRVAALERIHGASPHPSSKTGG
ncbi:MAG: hypothetical protein ACYC8T_38125 [Myxococcaceae bacterium]